MGHAITFAQQKGGAGKTTVLAHLAAAWAAAGRKVAIIDLDPQRSLTRWATLRGDPSISVIDSKDYRAGGDIKTAKILLNAYTLYRGTHLSLNEVKATLARKIEVSPVGREEIHIETDGELPGKLPAVYEIVPQALRVRVPRQNS